MKNFILAALAALSLSGGAHAEEMKMDAVAEVGKPAPEFMANDLNGDHVMLSALKGQTVVLEWTNHECPYVQKHYGSGNMQKLQKEAADDGVVWISIVSSAKDKEGYTSPEEAKTIMEQQAALPTHKILDVDGTIGHLFGAKTTPNMFVIDKDGILVYSGAIDDNNSFKPETIEGAKNYVREALASLKAGKPVEMSSTQPYGCGVKY
ncbi:MAG: thioredoxin family protein [Alphaproteobacteria bacterium CG1_02_46_17]|nr:MAG: thioredoxin family protein [Alphaproteobacteria bacterium CG1_02_46_17]